MAKTLSIDIETYSDVDLTRCGVHRYVDSPDFRILLIGYAFDDGPVCVVDCTKNCLNDEHLQAFQAALWAPDVLKTAYNAAFEMTCLGRWFGRPMDEKQWRCTAVLAATLGLPRKLGDAVKALGLAEEKMDTGKRLIDYFSKPCKPTETNGGRARNLPEHDPAKWRTFIDYNQQDVIVERELRKRLSAYPLPPKEQAAWEMDQRINARGVGIDMDFVRAAIAMSNEHSDLLTSEARQLTGLDNPNSVAQLKRYFGADSLTKKDVAAMRETATGEKARALAIRQELGKTSVTKYEAIERSVCSDGRVHGLFQFYGANRTGRWAGRLVQVQNLPQNHLEDLEAAREIAKSGDREGLEMLYGNVPSTLSELIRTAFVARAGCTFAVADFSAIEARVVAWLADEKWRQKVFESGGDIYCASASQMFKVPVEKHGQNAHLRQKGKIAELALGYGGGVGALKQMGALEMGLTEGELQPLVTAWREASPRIVALWDRVGAAVMNAVKLGGTYKLPHGLGVERTTKRLLHIHLPSGRSLRYFEPQMTTNKFGGESVSYQSYEAGRWSRVESYGPKFVENVVQAIARDCLRDAMLAVEPRYPVIVMHVHDEMVVEVPERAADAALRDICEIMARPLPWAPGLVLRGDGYVTKFYRKD